MTSYAIGYKENYVKTTCAAKSSLRLDLNETRNLTNTLRVQYYLENGLRFYFFIYFKAVLTVNAPKVSKTVFKVIRTYLNLSWEIRMSNATDDFI